MHAHKGHEGEKLLSYETAAWGSHFCFRFPINDEELFSRKPLQASLQVGM